MEEKNALKVVEEIDEKRKLPKEIKDRIDKTFFNNNLMAIFMMLYFILINLSYIYLNEGAFERFMKYIAMIMIITTVVVFEIAYKKDSFKIALIGIEFLVCSLLSVYIPYIFLYTIPLYRRIMMIIPIFLAVYYIAKTIAIYWIRDLKHKSNLSDVKEIVKYNEDKSYIDEESTKTLKENKKKKEQEKILRQKQLKEQKNQSLNKKQKLANREKNSKHQKNNNEYNKAKKSTTKNKKK